MRIFLLECKKVILSPVLIGLFLLFTGFNFLVIFNSSDHRAELKMVNEIIDTYGREITPSSLQQFQDDIQNDLLKLQQLTGKRYDSVNDFLEDLDVEEYERYSKQEQAFLSGLQVKEMYESIASSIDENYEEIDIEKEGEVALEQYQLSGKAAETYLAENEKFTKRFDEMIRNGEHKQWFFAGKAYYMHTLLFKDLFSKMTIEILLLVILSTTFLATYEFEQRTHLVAFATQRGRRLMNNKLVASLVMAFVITGLVLGSTLGVFFLVFDYSHVWETSVSSAFNWEYNFPYVSWWDLSFAQFLLGVIGVLFVSVLLISALTFSISLFIKNSYVSFFVTAASFILLYMLPSFMPHSSNWLFVAGYTVPTLVMAIPGLFMGSSGLIFFRNFEWATICSWTAITMGVLMMTYRRFVKSDIQ
ncbi:multisubunit Na+/H+ antiporter MnhC subunit [Sporosarcina luteola]|nr:multisubunit Na+/H+ antiporter MnhC subunit [Sporosarcina luteola]